MSIGMKIFYDKTDYTIPGKNIMKVLELISSLILIKVSKNFNRKIIYLICQSLVKKKDLKFGECIF